MIKKKRLFDSVFQKITTMIAVIAMMIAIITQLNSFYTSKKDLRQQSYFIESMNDSLLLRIKNEQISLKEQFLNLNRDSIPNEIKINEKLKAIDLRLTLLENQTRGLREAINPLQPDEVLTIARLKDGLKIIEEKQKTSTTENQEKFESFKTSILRELDASSKSINWLFLVLIPLVMNLLYSMWKDRKEKKVDKENNE